MVSLGIDGMISGLKTSDLINQLMQVEAMPQTMLKSKVATTQAFVSALQGLNTRVASLADVAKNVAKPESWQAATGVSSVGSVKVTTSAGAQPSSLSFTVDQLATAQTSVSGNVPDLASFFGGTVPSHVTIASGSGADQKAVVVDLAGVTDLSELAAKLNAPETGVTASVVKISATESRLQITGKATGEKSSFDVYAGKHTKEELVAGVGAPPVVNKIDALVGAVDAKITVWGEQQITSASNTFSDVLAGVSFSVSQKTTEPATITVSRDDAALTKLAKDLVGAMGVVLSEIKSRTSPTTTTSEDGRTVITGGVLSADSATRGIQQSVTTAMSYPVDGISPSAVGITVTKEGTFTLDEAKFAEALAKDPAMVEKVVTGIAKRVSETATGISDSIDGSLTSKIKNQESFSKGLSEQVSDWDRRLANRRSGLERTYASLEVTLSGLQSQSSWLAGQLAGLSSNS